MEDVKTNVLDQYSKLQLDDARLVVIREEHVVRFLNLIDELKEMTDFLRQHKSR